MMTTVVLEYYQSIIGERLSMIGVAHGVKYLPSINPTPDPSHCTLFDPLDSRFSVDRHPPSVLVVPGTLGTRI
jgi:hypothetical protein